MASLKILGLCFALLCLIADADLNIPEEIIALKKELKQQKENQAIFEENLQRKISMLEHENAVLKGLWVSNGSYHKRQVVPDIVGFYATMTPFTNTLTVGETLKYDEVICNEGGGYNPTTGVFTAPVSGLYSFSTTVMSYSSENAVHIELIKNGKQVGRAYSNDNNFNTGSQTIVIRLDQGDTVSVRQFFDQGTSKLHGLHYTTFSGFLIAEFM